MTQVEDEKRQAWLTGGLLTTHRQMKEKEQQLQSILLSAGRGRGCDGGGADGEVCVWGGSSQGSRVTLYQHPTDTHKAKPVSLIPRNTWGGGG